MKKSLFAMKGYMRFRSTSFWWASEDTLLQQTAGLSGQTGGSFGSSNGSFILSFQLLLSFIHPQEQFPIPVSLGFLYIFLFVLFFQKMLYFSSLPCWFCGSILANEV